jgi:hypothetical protein
VTATLFTDNPWIDARRFGVSGDGSTDQTTALQAAIDYAQTKVVGNLYGAPVLMLPPGKIVVSSTILWKSCALQGSQPNNGTRIAWNGTVGGTMIQKWSTNHAGNASWCSMSNVHLTSGTTEPGTFIDYTASPLIDFGNRLTNVSVNGCTSDAIKLGNWINCHWEHLRFDLVGGYAIRLTPPTQNLSSFRLDGFTYDHSRVSGPGSGVFLIDNTAASGNLGTLHLSNARIEVNAAWAAAGAAGSGGATRAIIAVRSSGATAPRSIGLSLQNVTYADATGMADDVLVFADDASAVQVSLHWWNVRTSSLSNTFGGNYNPSTLLTAPSTQDLSTYGSIANTANGTSLGGIGTGGRGARIYSGSATPEAVVTAPIGSIYLRTDGGAATCLYVKESGVSNTGWVAK